MSKNVSTNCNIAYKLWYNRAQHVISQSKTFLAARRTWQPPEVEPKTTISHEALKNALICRNNSSRRPRIYYAKEKINHCCIIATIGGSKTIIKKIISAYLVFVFMLMTFSGCERIKNSLGLVKPANVENPESPENSKKSDPGARPPQPEEELTNQSNKSYEPPECDLGGTHNVRKAQTIFFATLAATLAAWISQIYYVYEEIPMPPVLDYLTANVALVGIPATIGTGIYAYKATVSKSKKRKSE